MKKKILIATAIAAMLAAALVLQAQQPPMHHGFGHGHGLNPMAHLAFVAGKLDLSDQQVSEIKDIFADLRTQNAPYRQQFHGGLRSIAQTLVKNPNDVAAAQALLDQQNDAEKALKANTLVAVSKALNVLTPEQRAKLGTMIEEHAAQWERHSR
ncbi:MAG: periplasmic heavy metal sensor [Acidobacteria bacterium]|nr:periplasmic heavy metal sensor [Acidobacteriota bacterium]MBV9477320.1 periplasmic heavy metal sensor [Acidobacteriota bacterium]